MSEKLTDYEKYYIDAVIEHTKRTRDTAEGVSGWGGTREGAGRKPTGRSKRQYFLSDDEDVQVKKLIKRIREES